MRRLTAADDRITITVDGQELVARAGESVATALLANGIQTMRCSVRRGEPRGVFCTIGVCFECLMTIDGRPRQRACVTTVAPGMVVQRETGEPQSPVARAAE